MKYTVDWLGPKLDEFLNPLLKRAGFELTYDLRSGENPVADVRLDLESADHTNQVANLAVIEPFAMGVEPGAHGFKYQPIFRFLLKIPKAPAQGRSRIGLHTDSDRHGCGFQLHVQNVERSGVAAQRRGAA